MKFFLKILFCLDLIVLSSCVPMRHELYKDDKVKVTEKGSVNLLNVHASRDTICLESFGRTFLGVRGHRPYYLEIPEKKLLLFVTGESVMGESAVIHVLNLKTKQFFLFPAYDSRIGNNICRKERDGSDRYEKIESVFGDKVVIVAHEASPGAVFNYRYYLDLKKPEFEKEEVERIGGGGSYQQVYINGKHT